MNIVPIEYTCPPLTLEQLTLLDPQAPFATAVQKVLDMDFPLYVTASIRRYFFYKRQQYATQKKIWAL